MASDGQENHRVGEHWSGGHPVPTIQKFIDNLDHDKKDRDRRIDEENRAKKQYAKEHKHDHRDGELQNGQEGKVVSHQARDVAKDRTRMVTDPTTGKEIGVEDQDKSAMETVKDPKVRKGLLSFYS